MTRASLLQILDHVSAISEPEIRELEQLAAAFPYCQTAHVLLAKAAHDRDSMLAGQRLRRAATYAADRQLLRQLIEQPAPAAVAVLPPFEVSAPEPTAPELALELPVAPSALIAAELPATDTNDPTPTDTEQQAATPTLEATLATADDAVMNSLSPNQQSDPESLDTADDKLVTVEFLPEPAPTAAALELPQESGAVAEHDTHTPQPVAVELTSADEVEVVVAAAANDTPEPSATPVAGATPDDSPAAAVEDSSAVHLINQDVTPEHEAVAEEASVDELPADAADDILPAVAPPIRPPVGVGSSRFEFGLGLPAPDGHAVVYELPTLDEPEPDTAPPLQPSFRGDDHLGYALGGGSRMGYCLQPTDDFTQPLPGPDFFPPDALLHSQAARYQPAPPPAPSPFDLINKFLHSQPRLRTPAPIPASAEEQADLSVRSTQGVPDLASESLAKIMIRQGKVHKAIEIYERLMVRQPEKKAYFADQIQQLKSTE